MRNELNVQLDQVGTDDVEQCERIRLCANVVDAIVNPSDRRAVRTGLEFFYYDGLLLNGII